MNNDTEFLDQTKPLDPKVLNKINAAKAANEPAVEQTDGVENQNLVAKGQTQLDQNMDLTALDFSSNRGLSYHARKFVRLQDVSNLVLNGYRVPYCNDNFRPIIVPESRDKVPVIPYNYYVTTPYHTGGGDTHFLTWLYSNGSSAEAEHFKGLIRQDVPFKVQMDETTKAQLMTLVTIWSNEYLDKGVRDARARPNAVLGDWSWALTPTYSMTHRCIRTDVIAHWMYSTYTPTSPATNFKIINATDMRSFMNITGGNYWPISQDTLCLALGQVDTTDLPNLANFGQAVIIDLDSSMNAGRGNLVAHNGVAAYEVAASNTVNPCDYTLARVINNTFSAIDIQWALASLTVPLAANTYSHGVYADEYKLRVYTNSVCDQFVNFYMTHRDNGNKLPTSNTTLPAFVQAWRVFKTVLTLRGLVDVGCLGRILCPETYGKDLTLANYNDLIACEAEIKITISTTLPDFRDSVLWIPYEMWIANGANIQLDSEDYVDGDSAVMVNKIYNAPRSHVCLLFPYNWDANVTGTTTYCDYYVPNNRSPAISSQCDDGSYAYQAQSFCFPNTVPRYSSTSETATAKWEKNYQIDFKYTATGKNSNSVYRKNLVFSSAVKN